ncbi:MAG: HEAT repeat domain-containing protein [Thermoanaerobaculia bacterium]
MSWRCSILGAALAAAAVLNGCASSTPAGVPGGDAPAPPSRTFASPDEAGAALLEAEDRKAYDPGLLSSAAQSPDPAVRARAAWAIGRIGDERGGPLLVRLLSDSSPEVRTAACFGAQVLSDPTLTSDLIPRLADADPRVVVTAAKAIGFLSRGDGQDALVAAIPSAASPEPRATLLRSLWRFANPASEAAALPFVSDPDPTVRFAAIYALARKPIESSGPALVAALRGSEPDTAAAAARALGVLARREHVQPLAAALDAGRAPLTINALVALEAILERNPGTSLPADRVARVLALAGDANPNVAVPALVLLRQFEGGDREVRRRLWSIATTGTGRRREVALLSVVASLRGRAEKAIEAAVASPEPSLRAAAAESLSHLPAAEAKSWRDRLLADKDPLVRAAALASLATAEAARQNRGLAEAALADPDPGVRAAAIEVLATPNDPAVLPLLSQALERAAADPSSDVAIAALDAAEKLRSSPAARALAEAAYRQPNALTRNMARRALMRAFRAAAADFPRVAYETRLSAAEYAALLAEAKKPRSARIETARGSFTIRLAGAEAARTVMNFVQLARRNYFDGVRIHRVVPNFVLQDGDPTGTGNGGPGYEIRDEINPLEYGEGTVGMALSGPDTGGSQWFVTHAPQPHLDGIYTVFGQVTDGQDVVERTEQGERILRVTILEGP